MSQSRGWLSRPWLITGLSVGAFAVLSVLLWSPWNRASFAGGQRLRLYCANGMIRPVEEIIGQYRDKYNVSVEADYDGSGNLLAKLRTPAEADLYLAADSVDMNKARREGLVAEIIPIARIYPVLVVNRSTHEELLKKDRPIRSAHDLLRPDLRVVLADPHGTAIGQLTTKFLEPPGIWSEILKALKDPSARVSTGGPVNSVAEKVQTRDGFVGIVWSAVAAQYPNLVAIPVPEFDGAFETVQIGVVTRSRSPAAALRFARYLAGRGQKDDEGKAIPGKEGGLDSFARHHFETIADADVWEENPELLIYYGAMLDPVVAGVIKTFEQREGVRITTNFKGCGLLVADMRNLKAAGSRVFPDAYVSCDVSFQDRVQEWFDAYARILENDLVLVVARGNPHRVQSLADLKRGLRIGLPHPEFSAMGEIIDRLLMKLGLHEEVYGPNWQDRIVHSDAAHTLINKLKVGALDVVVAGRSNARSAAQNVEQLDVIDIDAAGALATQTFAIAGDSPHKYLMRRLLEAIVAPANAERAESIGFRFIYGK